MQRGKNAPYTARPKIAIILIVRQRYKKLGRVTTVTADYRLWETELICTSEHSQPSRTEWQWHPLDPTPPPSSCARSWFHLRITMYISVRRWVMKVSRVINTQILTSADRADRQTDRQTHRHIHIHQMRYNHQKHC